MQARARAAILIASGVRATYAASPASRRASSSTWRGSRWRLPVAMRAGAYRAVRRRRRAAAQDTHARIALPPSEAQPHRGCVVVVAAAVELQRRVDPVCEVVHPRGHPQRHVWPWKNAW